MRALIAAGDAFAAARIRAMLAKESLVCDATDLGRDSFVLSKFYDYDIILLDLRVPDIGGYTLLQQLRAAGVRAPVLIVSQRGEIDEKVKFLRSGADDFLTKPFDRRELVARILAIVRRSKGHCQSTIRTGKLALNLDTRIVSVEGAPVKLTPKEYGILELLSLRKGTILTRGMILNHVYGGMDEPQPKIVDIFVCTLRKKLARATGGSHYIETVRGGGYALREMAAMPAATPIASPKDLSADGSDVCTKAVKQPTAGRVCRSRPAKPPSASFPVEVQFQDAVTRDGGPLRVPRPDPAGSLFGCASARCQE